MCHDFELVLFFKKDMFELVFSVVLIFYEDKKNEEC